MRGVDFMINKTKMIIPKKYHIAIDEVMHDSTGYWIWLNENYYSTETGCQTIREDTQKELLAQLKTIKPIENKEIEKVDFKYIYCDAINDMVIKEFYYKGDLYTFSLFDLVYYSDDECKMFYEVPTNATPNK